MAGEKLVLLIMESVVNYVRDNVSVSLSWKVRKAPEVSYYYEAMITLNHQIIAQVWDQPLVAIHRTILRRI